MARKQRIVRALEDARSMPARAHDSLSGDRSFSVENSFVCDWLAHMPAVQQVLFDIARENGFIVYDKKKGVWHGADRDSSSDIKIESLPTNTRPTVSDVMDIARQHDKIVDHFIDRFESEIDHYSSRESYWIDNLMFTHLDIAAMMYFAITGEDRHDQ